MTQFHRLLVAGSLTAVVVGSVLGMGTRLGAFGLRPDLAASDAQVGRSGGQQAAVSEPWSLLTVPDSGGAGQWRGGQSFQREYELLEDATVVRRFDKSRFPPGGLAGGGPGGRSRFVVRLGMAEEHESPASGRFEMKAGERFLLQSAGGGGYGDPRQREGAALAHDVAEGFVTADGATKDYGR